MKIVEQIAERIGSDGTAVITTKEVAALVRAKLKASFPGVKFSVRSDANAVDVRWVDGPTAKTVDAVIDNYKFGGFDGSIDLAYCSKNWLLPNGDMLPAESSGTVGSGGYHEAFATDCPVAGAVIVKFGPRHVFSHRSVSDERLKALATELADKYGWEIRHDLPYHSQRFDGEYLTTLAHQYESKTGAQRS